MCSVACPSPRYLLNIDDCASPCICQASTENSGNYSCSVPEFISTPVRIHIVEGISLSILLNTLSSPFTDENQAFVASGNTNIAGKVKSGLVNVVKLLIYFLSCSNASIICQSL